MSLFDSRPKFAVHVAQADHAGEQAFVAGAGKGLVRLGHMDRELGAGIEDRHDGQTL